MSSDFVVCVMRCVNTISSLFGFSLFWLELYKLETSSVIIPVLLACLPSVGRIQTFLGWHLCGTVKRNAIFDPVLIYDEWMSTIPFYVKSYQATMHQITVRTYSGLLRIYVWCCSEWRPAGNCIFRHCGKTWWLSVPVDRSLATSVADRTPCWR